MTSTNDGKDVKSNITSGPKGKSYYIELYKSLEAHLCEGGSASERTKHLCEAWRRVHSLCQHSAPSTHTHLLSWLQRHTSRAVLQTDWQKPERKDDRKCLEEAIDYFIAESDAAAASRNGGSTLWELQLVARGEWFKRVLEHPWDHPVLTLLLNPNGTPPTDEEVLEWLKEERGVTFVMRLHTLVGEKCDDIAVSLASAVMERVRAGMPPVCDTDNSKDKTPENAEPTFGDRLKEEAGFTQDVMEALTDIEFVLLHKRDSKRCITLAKQTPLMGAYHLIERLQKRLEISPREKRLWKNSKEVAVLIAQVVIARCMMVSACAGAARTALYCCARLLARLLAGRLPAAAAALATQAPTAAHLHTLAHAVDKQLSASNEMKPYVCELYVRAITAGMNELERLKLKTEKEADARLMEKTLALWFVQLGTVLAHNDRLHCECTLTAFSLHPSQKMYERLDAAPQLAPVVADSEPTKDETVKSEFGSWANDSRSQTNFVKTSETLNLKQTQNQANVLSTAIFNEGEALGLSPELCQDIAVLLSGPRIKTLSWDMDRTLLLENCRAYMERTGSGTRGLTHELKYLNIDLNQYQHLPEERDEDENDPYYGIEKGYEHLATPEEPDEIWEYANDPERTDSASSYIEDDFIVPRRKNKNKKLLVSSDEDSDPLSFMAEAKKVQKKKERPHSKERSKERAKKKQECAIIEDDPLRIETPTPNDKQKPKEKKERKKKEKASKGKPLKSLSDLVGVKVEKSKKQMKTIKTTRVIAPMTDSDYDSQGKCSLASLNSEGNELHDGLLPMDELKPPEHKSSYTVNHSEILKKKQLNIVSGNTLKGSPSSSFENLPSNFNRMSYRPPTPSSVHRYTMPNHARTSSPSLGRCKNDVRASITKLMEFRRQQAARTNLQSNTAQPPQRKPAIMRPDIPLQTNVSPKAVAIPEIPKSYIKKEHADKLAEIKREVDNLIAERKKIIQKNSVIQYASKDINKARSDSSQSHSGAQQSNVHPVKMADIVNVPYDRLMAEISERQGRVESAKPTLAQYQPGKPNVSTHRSLNVMTAGQRDYQNFLKEYDHTKYGPCTSGRPLDMSKNSKKDIRPVNKVEPVVPQCTITKVNPKALQSAKLSNTQKKPEVSLNTFSRLSYMLKNKHNEMKNKNLQEKPVYSHSTYQEVSSELDEIIKEHKRAQMQVIQAKNERLLAKTQTGSAHEHIKNETSAVKSGDHSLFSNLLQNSADSTANTATCRNSALLKSCQIQQKAVSPPKTSLSEKDHHDLLQLLRQQSKLNAPHNQSSNANLKLSTANSTNAVSKSSPMNDLKSMPFQKQEQHSKQASQANHHRLVESKVINIISNSLIKPANENVDKYANFVDTKSNTNIASDSQDKVKKPAASKVLTKKIPVKLNPEVEKSEWQSVMSDILKHKTPLRGPNALDVALNKSSFEKVFENSLQDSAIYAQRHSRSKIDVESDKLYEKPLLQSSSTSPQNVVITTNKAVKTRTDIPKQHKSTYITKKKSDFSINEKLMKQNPEIAKKIPQEVQRKQFTYAGPKHDDPFISGIPNSDYDLLEELMDDDLRKEIGELSSDDDSYNVAAQSFLKPTKGNEKRVSVEFNKPLNDTAIKSAGNVQCLNTRQPDSTMPSGIQKSVKSLNNMAPRTQRNDSLNLTQKVATNKTQGVSLMTSTVQSVPSHIPVAANTLNHPYNNAQALTNSQVMIDPNIYISAVPQQAPLQNVLLIGSELVYKGYSTVQTPVHTSSTYVAVNNVPNMTLYETQFGAPVVNPLIIESSIVVPTVSNVSCTIPVQSTGVDNSTQRAYFAINAEAQKPGPDLRVFEKESCDRGETSNPAPGTDSPLLNNKMNDVTKTVERKVLSEVQEFVVTDKTDKARSLNIEMKKDVSADQERLMNKRLAIINREIYHRCRNETIPLSYTPLPVKTRMLSKLHDFAKAIPLDYTSLNPKENKDKLSDNADDTLLLAQIKNNLQDLSNAINEVKSPATPDSIESKENKSHATAPCRRILLRSSNKISLKVTAVSSASESSLNKKSKVKLKSAPVEPVAKVVDADDKRSQNNSSNQAVQAQKRASKRLRNKTLTIIKDEKSPLKSQRQKPTPKVATKNKSNKSDANIEKPTLKVLLNELTIFDFEAELLGSKISKTVSENKEGQQNYLNVSEDNEIDKKFSPATKTNEIENPMFATHEKTQNIIQNVTNKNIHKNELNINDLREKINDVIPNGTDKGTRNILEKETAESSNVIDEVLDKFESAKTKSVFKIKEDEKVDIIDEAFDKPINDKNESVSEKTVTNIEKDVEVNKINDEMVDTPIRKKTENVPEKKDISDEWFNEPATQIISNASDKEADKNITVKDLDKPEVDDKNLNTPNPEEPASDTYDYNLIPLVPVTGSEIRSLKNTVEELTAKCTTPEETKNMRIAVNNSNTDKFKENIDLEMTVTCEETNTPKKTSHFSIIRSARNKSINIQTKYEGIVSNIARENETQAFNSGHIQSIPQGDTGKTPVEPFPALSKVRNACESIASQQRNTRKAHVSPSAVVEPTNNVNDFDDDVVVIDNDCKSTSNTPIVGNSNNSPQNKMKTEVTLGCTNTSEISNMSQSFLDSVNIEKLPSDEPLKKNVRVTLPNGRKFKLTVTGEMHVTLDTLFACPSIKEALLNGLNCKKYTMKMQQIAKVKKNDRSKIISALIKNQDVNTTRLGSEPVETIDLLSDDEDVIPSKVNDTIPQIFETEFGKYKIVPIDHDLFKKHQTKLILKSLILLKKVDEKPDIGCGTLSSVNVINNSILEVMPDKYVKGIINDFENDLTSNTKKSSTDQIVEIDDSSNDSMNNVGNNGINKPEEKIKELKNELLKELGVEAIILPIENTTKADSKMNNNDSVVEIDLTDDNHQPSEVCDLLIDPNKEKNPLHNLTKEDQLKITSRKCHVKLVRCDVLSTIYEKQDKIALEKIYAKVSDDQTFNITEKYSILDYLDKTTVETDTRSSSPVLELSDVLISLDSVRDQEEKLQGKSASQQVIPLSCEANWFTTKSTINMECPNDDLMIRPSIYKYHNTDNERDSINVAKHIETFSSDSLSNTSPTYIEHAVNHVVPLTCKSNWFTSTFTLNSKNEKNAVMMRHSVFKQHDYDNHCKHATTSEAIEMSANVEPSASRDDIPSIYSEPAVTKAIPLTCVSNWFTTKSTLHSMDGDVAEIMQHNNFKQHDNVTYSKNAIINAVSEMSTDAELFASPDDALPIHSNSVVHLTTPLLCEANWLATKSTLHSRARNYMKPDILDQNNGTHIENTTSDIITEVLTEPFDSSVDVSVIHSKAVEHQVNSLSCELNGLTYQTTLHLKIVNSAILSGSNNFENLDKNTHSENATIDVVSQMSSDLNSPTVLDDTSRIRISVTHPVTPLSCEANWFSTKSSLHSRNLNNALARTENTFENLDEDICNESANINVFGEMVTETEPTTIADDTSRIRISVMHPVTSLSCEANWFTTKSSLHSRNENNALLARAYIFEQHVESSGFNSVTTKAVYKISTEQKSSPPFVHIETVLHQLIPLSCEANWFTSKSTLHLQGLNNAASILPKVFYQRDKETDCESPKFNIVTNKAIAEEEVSPRTNCAPSLVSLALKCFQDVNIIDQFMLLREAINYIPVNSLKRKSTSPGILTACKVSKLDDDLIIPELNYCGINLTLESSDTDTDITTSDLEENTVDKFTDTVIIFNEPGNKNIDEDTRSKSNATIENEDQVLKAVCGQTYDDIKFNLIDKSCEIKKIYFETVTETVHGIINETDVSNIGSINVNCSDYQSLETTDRLKEINIKSDLSRSPSPIIEIGHILANDKQYNHYGPLTRKSINTKSISLEKESIYKSRTPSPTIQIEIMHESNETNVDPIHCSVQCLEPPTSQNELQHADDICSFTYLSKDMTNTSLENDDISTQNSPTNTQTRKVNKHTVTDDLDDIEVRLAEIVGQSLKEDNTGKQCNQTYNLIRNTEKLDDNKILEIGKRKFEMESDSENIKIAINEEKQCCIDIEESPPKEVQFLTFTDHQYSTLLPENDNINLVDNNVHVQDSNVHNGIFLSEDEATEEIEEEIVYMYSDEIVGDISPNYSPTENDNDVKDLTPKNGTWTTVDEKVVKFDQNASSPDENFDKTGDLEVTVLEVKSKNSETTDFLAEKYDMSNKNVNNNEKAVFTSGDLSAETILSKYLSLFGNNSEVLEGIVEYEDPEAGTCYVIPIIEKSSKSVITSDEDTEIVKERCVNKTQTDDEIITPLTNDKLHDCPINYDDIESRLAQIVGEPLMNTGAQTEQCNFYEISDNLNKNNVPVHLDVKYKTFYSIEVESISESELNDSEIYAEDNLCPQIKNNDHLKQNTSELNDLEESKWRLSNKGTNRRSRCFEKSTDDMNIEIYTENFKVMRPKHTYSRSNEPIRQRRKSLKRKLDMSNIKTNAKKYRKGKNIDYPKKGIVASENTYSSEYKCLLDYCSSIKFSYAIPFHKEDIDVHNALKAWPIKNSYSITSEGPMEENTTLFTQIEQMEPVTDPMKQTLMEEIMSEYTENSYKPVNIDETNFNMGFGEGSGRVIQELKDGEHTTFSAATLSDVKQLQPLLPSDNKETLVKPNCNISNEHDQRLNTKRFIDHLHLKEKVQSFFEKTKAELYFEWKLTNNKKIDENSYAATDWPFDLTSPKSFTPPPVEAIVNVVQVGQPPVSTAAQNPVTCDPRVTHVSNVSPSQCSPENSSGDDLQTTIKTEYTELTTAEITLPLMQEYAQRHHRIPTESQESINLYGTGDNASMCTEIKSIVKIELMEETSQDNMNENSAYENNSLHELSNGNIINNGGQYRFHNIDSNMTPETDPNVQAVANSSKKSRPAISFSKDKQQIDTSDKSDQIPNVTNAAGITTTQGMPKQNRAPLINTSSHNAQADIVTTSHANVNNYTKSTPINALALQQALAQILPPPLNQTNTSENNQQTPATPPVLHIVQGNNTTQSVINKPNGTPVLHIVQNKNPVTNGTPTPQANTFGGLPLIDGAIQQNGNQLLHIVNTGNQKNSNAGQLLKRVNLLTNLANVQGSNEQKMVQFVCKSADGKSIQLPHQRSMVLRLQPLDSSSVPTTTKQNEAQDLSQSSSGSQSTRIVNDKEPTSQEMKSRSLYEENYAKFVQNGESKPGQEKATSLPKFNQVFGKQIYQDKQNEMDSENLPENSECPQDENNAQLEQMSDIGNPPPLIRKPHNPAQPSQAQPTLVQQIKQTIAPMNIQTMHGGVIYTRQIPVNIGNGQTINLITVPSTELVDDTVQKQQTDGKFGNQEGEPPIIKIIPTSQPAATHNGSTDNDNNTVRSTNEVNAQPKPQPQPQPVLTQMRIKLPMLSKAPQMVGGTRVVRPSFFQIQRNVIGGANQQVYQQLVLTAAPSLGQSIRVPAQTPKPKSSETQSPESQMSSSTLEQLREFDMVLEQVKERSTVQPGTSTSKTNNSFSKLKPSADTNDSATPSTSSQESSTPVLYSVGNSQPLNMVNFINRKSTITSTSTSSFVRSPDSTGIVESPSSSTHSHLPHTSTSDSCASSCASEAAVATTVTHKPKKKKPKPSTSNSNPFNIKNTPKPSSQKPLEDEQTTQRILYILAEYKEQVENSPDKDKPAPRRRNNPAAPNAGSSKRKKSSSGSRRRDMSPVVGEDSCRTMGSEDSSCGTSLGECNECLDTHSPEESPRKVVRRLTFEQETHITTQTRTIPQRNVIVADGQAFAVRGATGKPATTVLMPANYLLPVSMVKGGQQIAIVTNRGPKLLVGAGEGGAGGTLLLQRLIGPGGLKPVLARPGVRHIRLPTAALHNLQAFNIATPATVQPPDSTASPASAPTPPDLVDTRAMSSPWPDREAGESKPDGGNSSPDGSEPWNLPSSSIADDYGYEEIVRTDNMDRTVLDAIPDRYSPDMEAQRIFDKMFDVDSKKSMYDSRCGYDIDASDDDKAYHQVVQRKDGRHTRLTHVSAAALRHKYAILEHELRLQKSLSEECEDLGVDSPSASDLFPEAELLFAPSPAHEQTIDQCHTPQPSFLHGIPQPDLDDQIATDHLLTHSDRHDDLDINLDDVGEIVTVGEDGMTTIPLDHDEFARSHEEFARSHPNTTFHSEPEDGEIPPFTIAQGIKGRQITFHNRGAPGTVVMAPQTTVISQATVEATGAQNTVKFTDIDNMINSMPSPQHPHNINIPSALVKDNSEGLTKFDRLLNESKEHLPNTASAIVHSTGNGTQVIRRVSYETVVSGDGKTAETRGMQPLDNDTSSPERQNLFWENNAPRAEKRRFDFSSEKCCRSPYEEVNSDSSGIGAHTRLDSVIKAARTVRRRSDASEETHPPLRTYPAKRSHQHHNHSEERSVTKRASDRCHDGKDESKRRASNRGVVKRGCQCCNGSTALQKPKKSRPKKSDYPTH